MDIDYSDGTSDVAVVQFDWINAEIILEEMERGCRARIDAIISSFCPTAILSY